MFFLLLLVYYATWEKVIQSASSTKKIFIEINKARMIVVVISRRGVPRMLDSSYLLPFDLFQQLVIWLGTSMQTYRNGRRFLETNQVLLRAEIERELERLISAHAEEKVEMKQQM